jgi:hypothetical protein
MHRPCPVTFALCLSLGPCSLPPLSFFLGTSEVSGEVAGAEVGLISMLKSLKKSQLRLVVGLSMGGTLELTERVKCSETTAFLHNLANLGDLGFCFIKGDCWPFRLYSQILG